MTTDISAGADRTVAIDVNGRSYRWPTRPVVVICFDGCDGAYLAAASKAGRIPAIDAMVVGGFATTALAALPTFTNPNNVSIVCGVLPSMHGVSGNYYIDRATGQEVMVVDATPMRAPTILAAFAAHDLSRLAGERLRSDGGVAEQQVPFYLSRPLSAEQAGVTQYALRNYDIFDFALNRIET